MGIWGPPYVWWVFWTRSEEHTSELQPHSDLVCRLLLEQKNTQHFDEMARGRGARVPDAQDRHPEAERPLSDGGCTVVQTGLHVAGVADEATPGSSLADL